MRTLFCFMLWAGSLAGQDSGKLPLRNDGPLIDSTLTFTPSVDGQDCDGTIAFRGHSKLVKDIFPEECGAAPKSDSHRAIWGNDGPLEESPGKDIDINPWPDGLGHACGAYPCQPIDVPTTLVRPPCTGGCVPPPSYSTCADKSRILLTAEDGKKFCHKPQTGSAQ